MSVDQVEVMQCDVVLSDQCKYGCMTPRNETDTFCDIHTIMC